VKKFPRLKVQSFSPHSLQGKMFIITMIISCGVMLAAAYSITKSAVRTITGNAYQYIFENMRYADFNLNILLEDAAAISLAIASNGDTVIPGLEDQSPEASYEAFEVQKEVENYLQGMMINKSHILSAAVIGVDGKNFRSGGSLILKRIIMESWFKKAVQSSGVNILYNTPEEKRLLVCRSIVYNRRVLGLALIEMDYPVLNQVYASPPLARSRIIVFDENENLVFYNYDTGGIRTLEESELGPVMKSYNPAVKYWQIGREKVLIALYQSSYNKLSTLGCISYSSLMTEAWHINSLMLVIAVVSIAAAALASWLFSRGICRNIFRLQESMLRIQEGSMEVRSRIDSRDEIGVMSAIFDGLMDRIEELLRNVRETEEQKRRMEQMVLEAQIQPHFIYNTINSIAYAAHMRGEKELEDVASATVQLLRGVLGVRESFIPLWQEYEYVEQYLVIQRFKLRRKFQIDWDVEEDLWSYPIPKLILQPIVENALLHGILQKEDGKISVQVFRRQEMLVIKVTDNGRGMTRQEQEQLRTPSQQFRRVGFSNVRDRIVLIYGEGYGAELTSFPGAFTCVELKLPCKDTPCSAS
jgi:two-component system sensor histidine kinase YesM